MGVAREKLPHTVYRMYDRKGRLLYVGMAMYFDIRLATHKVQQPWFSMVSEVKIERYPDRNSASDAETLAIRNEDPIFNVLGKRSRRGEGIRSVVVPSDPWYRALVVAHDRNEDIGAVVTALLRRYVAEYEIFEAVA